MKSIGHMEQRATPAKVWCALAFVLLVLLLGGCELNLNPAASSHGGPVRDYVSLIDHLRAAGATVESTGAVSQPFLTPHGQAITVDGQPVQVYEYADEAATRTELARFATDGGTVRGADGSATQVEWLGPPHLFLQGRIIAIYVGTDQHVLGLLRDAMGPQVAGR